MKAGARATIGLTLLVTALLSATGCNLSTVEVGPVQTESKSVELGSAEAVTADITIGAGRLEIGGGGTALLNADFTYNVAEWQPEVAYRVSGDEGRLQVKQPSTENEIPAQPGKVRYEWELRFDQAVPLELDVTMGAGDGRLELGDLQLARFEFQGGAGDVDIDLSGSELRDLDVRMGAGNVTLDLSGDRQQDLLGNIKGGVGRVTVLLPGEVGVRVKAQKGIGSVNATGLNQDGDVYTNDAYGESEVILDMEVEGAVGEINLRIVD